MFCRGRNAAEGILKLSWENIFNKFPNNCVLLYYTNTVADPGGMGGCIPPTSLPEKK